MINMLGLLNFFYFLIIIFITILEKNSWLKHYGVVINNICYTHRGIVQIEDVNILETDVKRPYCIYFVNFAWLNFHPNEINIYCSNFVKYKVNITYPPVNHVLYYFDNGVRIDNPYYYGSHVKLSRGTFVLKKKIRKGICMIENKVVETNIWPYISTN